MEIFRSTVSLQRFRLLLQCPGFDDRTTRAARSQVDKLAPLRQMFETLVTKYVTLFGEKIWQQLMRNLKNSEKIVPFNSVLQASQESTGLKLMPLCIPEPSTHKTLKLYKQWTYKCVHILSHCINQ
jgi:hypothetical protein